MTYPKRRAALLILPIFTLLFGPLVQAKEYTEVDLLCRISGREVSVVPGSNRVVDNRLSGTVTFRARSILYESDKPVKWMIPLSIVSYEASSSPGTLTESLIAQFLNPREVVVFREGAQVVVRFNFSQEPSQLFDLLYVLGSDEALSLLAVEEEEEIPSYQIINKKWANRETYQPVSELAFTGWYGREKLESCYQLDLIPPQAEAAQRAADTDNTLYLNGLSFHLCGECEVIYNSGKLPMHSIKK
ncbi:MAG: hypothetical protein IT288_06975 [Bdellovibrionales bacterium]|nr:hypothetical protein [Bdellovibrionales bacterium]